MALIGTTWGVGQAFLTILWITLFFIWISLLLNVFADIFRSHDLGGGAKALWVIFVIMFPYLGVFIYLVARGHKMSEHALARAEAQEGAVRDYIRSATGTAGSPAEEIGKLADLKERGAIDDAEFQRLKAKITA